MIDIEINCQKINDYLSSFLADENGRSKDKRDSNSFKNRSFAEVKEFSASKLPLVGNNESQKPNNKTNTLPYSIEEFHRRLKSFECGLWTCTAISPLLCAIYGWKLIKKDILSCVTCKALICTTLPLPNQIEAYKTFGGRLKERLKTGHKGWCGWPNKPSPPAFLHPPLHMTVHYVNNLVVKANNLLTLGNRIPYVNCEEILRKLGLEAKEVHSFFKIQPDASGSHLTAAILVLCGWGPEGEEKLKCSLCFRSIGVWNFLALSERSHYEELEKNISDREERKKVVEERKKNLERRLLIKEEKLKAKLLEEKKAALAEMEAKENALKLKLALEKISKLESSDFSNPSDESEGEEEMGEEEENLLLNENSINEFVMEGEGNSNSEQDFTAGLVRTICENNVLADADSSNSTIEYTSTSKHVTENEEGLGSETHDATLDTESEKNLESDECSKSSNENESEEDLWLEAVGGYVEESESNVSKPMYAPSSEGSEYSIDYPTDNTNRKRRRSDSSDDEYNEEEITSKRADYPTDNTKCKRRRSESSEDEYNEETTSKHKDYPTDNTKRKRRRSESSEDEYIKEDIDSKRTDYSTNNITRKRRRSGSSDDEYIKEEIDSKYTDYSTDNTNRKRCRSESSEDEYIEEEIASKCRRVEDSCDVENIIYSDIIENSNSCDNNENLTDDINNENFLLPTETNESNPESVEEEEMDEEEIEEVEENEEEIASLNKMKNSLFQPLEQHRHWCGWVMDYSSLYIDEVDTSIEGYKIIPPQICQLQPDIPDSSIVSSEKYAGNIVGLRTVRGILKSWARDQEDDDDDDIQEC